MTVYSYSRISAFEKCPFQYKLRYIDREKPDFEGIEAFMGSRVHDALEALYIALDEGRVLSLDEVLAHYEDSWDSNWSVKVKVIKKGYKVDYYRISGRNALEVYYNRYHPFDQEDTLGLEKEIRLSLDERNSLIGYIDRLCRREDGVYEIHDYKTSGRLPRQEDLDRDTQLALYHAAIREMLDDVNDVELVWHYLLFDKEMRSIRTDEYLNSLIEDTMSKIDVIENTKEFAPRQSMLCNWCGYQRLCPAKNGMKTLDDFV